MRLSGGGRRIGVAEDLGARLVEFIGHAAVLVIGPAGGLLLAVAEREQVARSAIGEVQDLAVGIGLDGFSTGGIVGEEIAPADLVGVGD